MIDANTIGADKYFHCKANCEATRAAPQGYKPAEFLSLAREIFGLLKGDPLSDIRDDLNANRDGREGAIANPNLTCPQICAPHRPNGLDPQY